MGPSPNKIVDPAMAMVMNNIVGAMMAGGGGGANPLANLGMAAMASAMQGGQGGGGMMDNRNRGYERDRRGGRQRGHRDRSPRPRTSSARSRSRDRGSGGGRRSGRRSPRRPDRSPEIRAEHEIYVGNYPVKFKETDVRKLFEDHDIKVGAIRMKADGLKVFAFAETDCLDMVEKAKNEMEGQEIQGRKLRVRSSKDTDKKKRERERGVVSAASGSEKKKRLDPLKKDDVTRHLVTAVVGFIDRQLSIKVEDQTEEFRGLMEAAKTAMSTAYNLPEDESLVIPRNLEDIFFRDVREDTKVVESVRSENNKKDEESGQEDEDDDGNWKRGGKRKDEEEEGVKTEKDVDEQEEDKDGEEHEDGLAQYKEEDMIQFKEDEEENEMEDIQEDKADEEENTNDGDE